MEEEEPYFKATNKQKCNKQFPSGEAEKKAGSYQSSCSHRSTTGSSSNPKKPRHSQATVLQEPHLNRLLLQGANTEKEKLKKEKGGERRGKEGKGGERRGKEGKGGERRGKEEPTPPYDRPLFLT
ncbi:hypothetical protein llap_9404 [Limosa lapponica baueri]|uniref:Uncharacterized protein n=1 Tax=Limosa lapponica baueri TaxID=1758121 RepID=A0A2I0U2J6_LIMLA|nr:hypothetical protein llap_9404 [Limosa lapponica baueri]